MYLIFPYKCRRKKYRAASCGYSSCHFLWVGLYSINLRQFFTFSGCFLESFIGLSFSSQIILVLFLHIFLSFHVFKSLEFTSNCEFNFPGKSSTTLWLGLLFFLCKCRNWITKLDNKILYSYGFLKSILINNGATIWRDKLHVG